jgi:hypothetical protein
VSFFLFFSHFFYFKHLQCPPCCSGPRPHHKTTTGGGPITPSSETPIGYIFLSFFSFWYSSTFDRVIAVLDCAVLHSPVHDLQPCYGCHIAMTCIPDAVARPGRTTPLLSRVTKPLKPVPPPKPCLHAVAVSHYATTHIRSNSL